MRSATVNEDHRRLVSVAPDAQVYAAIVDVDADVLRLVIQCCGEPGWRERHLARTGKQFSTSGGLKCRVLVQLPLDAADGGSPEWEMWRSRMRLGEPHGDGYAPFFVLLGDSVS